MNDARPPRPWFRVEANADKGSPPAAVVYVYDEIGESWWGGLSPKALVDEIDALDVDVLTVHINSPGGSAWDGIAIMNALRRHPARVEVVVDGLAASAASVVAMAGDVVTMNRGAQMMIHDASGGAWGNAELLEGTAKTLHKLSDSYADIYAARAGGDRETWRAAMRAETWYTAEEAVSAGLADAWDGSPGDAEPGAGASFDLSRFRYPGRTFAPPPLAAGHRLPVSSEPGPTQKEEDVMSYENLTAGLRERLGMADADTTDEAILAALDEALAEQADERPAGMLPEGAVVVDAAALAELQAAAQAGIDAREEQHRARRDGVIAAALADGRIAPAARDAWRAQLDKDEDGTNALLDSMPKNVVPLAEIGHASEEADPDAYPAHWKR